MILHERPSLRRPILIVAFAGWGDAGRAATMAAHHLVNAWSASTFAEIDPDPYYDFSATRPWVKLGEGQRQLTWPSHHLYARTAPDGGLDAIILLGTEPSLRWRAFAGEVVGLARDFGVSMAVTLGAYSGQLSHRDLVPVTGWAWPDALHQRLRQIDVQPIAYEGPTGMLSVLGDALAEANIPVAALWAALPGFLGPMPNPKGALALVRCLDRAFGLGVDDTPLAEAAAHFERQVDEAIQRARAMPGLPLYQSQDNEEPGNPASRESPLVGTLDQPSSGPPDLPSPEEAIRGVEEFLRQNGGS